MAIRLASPSLTGRAQPGIGRAACTTAKSGGPISSVHRIGTRPTRIYLKGLGATSGWGVNCVESVEAPSV